MKLEVVGRLNSWFKQGWERYRDLYHTIFELLRREAEFLKLGRMLTTSLKMESAPGLEGPRPADHEGHNNNATEQAGELAATNAEKLQTERDQTAIIAFVLQKKCGLSA